MIPPPNFATGVTLTWRSNCGRCANPHLHLLFLLPNRADILHMCPHPLQARGPAAKRAITPKVGEEPLNRQEYQAVRHATPSRRNTPAPTPQLYHNQGHGVAQALSDPPQRPAPAVPGLPQRVPQAWSVASPNFSAAASPLPKVRASAAMVGSGVSQ